VDQAILATLDEIAAHERERQARPGDVLVFLPGEREIRDAADMRKAKLRHTESCRCTRACPGRAAADFRAHGRAPWCATNVAETSLTVPGIRYVIDSGTARISRYSYRAKVQRLPIEAISQASANQRKGRCGRVEPGICIRLYSEEDFSAGRAFTDPEILRTNLAAVILQMLHLRLGDIDRLPVHRAAGRQGDQRRLQPAAGTLGGGPQGQLTPLGRQLARLPIDPRMGRMLLEAASWQPRRGADRRQRAVDAGPARAPAERQQARRPGPRAVEGPDSDFAALVNLWRGFEEQRQALTASPLRNWCRKNFLNYLRLREWRDSHRQLS
jgi:ATP-dependent helicase HrpA